MTAEKLRIYPSFYVFWAVFCLLDNEGILPLFLIAAVIHEAGHVIAIRACGGEIDAVELTASGAVLRQGRCLGYAADAAIALAGPAAGMAAAWLLSVTGYPMLAGANALLSIFNCLPVLPLDGGCFWYNCAAMTPFSLAGMRAVECVSVLTALALTVFGGVFLAYTGRNATVLAVGLCLLRANRDLLRNSRNCGMI